jgi:hypothetical protein
MLAITTAEFSRLMVIRVEGTLEKMGGIARR